MSVIDKFLHYVSFDTQSDEHSTTAPSTMKQLDLAKELEKELHDLGIENAKVDPYGIVYASLAPTPGKENEKAIGLIAHMDTAGEMSGKDVHPRIVKAYAGDDIVLNEQFSMNPGQFPALNAVIGDDVIVTDGTTLLGADDKAGVAIIMAALEKILTENIPHGQLWIAFTPDEEVGRGVENFDLEKFPADFAYTVDGSEIDCVDYETFNAAMAEVKFKGASIHPGEAKDKMINAAGLAVTYASMLPQWAKPEHTCDREGFIHLLEMSGDCENASLSFIVRDHDHDLFEHKKEIMKDVAKYINDLYPESCTVTLRDQYLNMKDYMHGDFEAVERAKAALEKCGITPRSLPIRGGTDGAMLTKRGLITPNLGTGGGNFHGRFEFASIQKMEKMVDVVCQILKGE
ncbi:MAG: peptidase T [Allobaculum sp.]